MKLGLFSAWAASLGLLTWRAFSTQHRGPLPSEVASTIVVYGVLGLFSGEAQTPAAVAGWGLVVAGYLNLFTLPGTDTLKPGAPSTAQAGANIGNAGSIQRSAA